MNGLMPYKGIWPKLSGEVFVAPGARVIGDVAVGHGSGIWFNSVVRGDDAPIRLGRYTNIQDGSIIHVQHAHPTDIGDYVTVGHNVILHGCTVGDNCLIGMGAIILTGAVIGENCIIGAGALITEGKEIPAGSLVVGSPGRVIRAVEEQDIKAIRDSARHYCDRAREYAETIKTT
ncbi:gamma carbonic anhydrase family protein [Anaeroselena agilis]|uniref:Gamma carbonic anhydrase family protein n=1 Tax=Anaeroselena agilis TaxID=3063788 RepID=A0ABU3NWM5_9FIRM|nr:gamma carbonic anhydrase family protein [Selenomonadales bacterium 4137-cl]